MMSICRVISCVVGRQCLLWLVRSLGRTLLAFALLHFVLQGQICLLLQVFLDFLLLHSAAAAAKSLQSCPTLCDPTDSSPPASTIPGILQARTRSGLPFPSPMHESEQWEWSPSVTSDSSRPHGLQPTRLLHPWEFPGKNTGVSCHCLLQLLHSSPL